MAKVKNQKQKERGVSWAFGSLQEALFGLALFFHDSLHGTLAGLAFLFAVSKICKEEKKAPFLLTSIFFALILGLVLKPLFSQERPCEAAPSAVACPQDFAMPSSHALLAFSLVFGSLGNLSFPAYLAFALFIGYSRMHLGVHTFEQVAAGAALALLAHFLAESFWRLLGWRIPEQIKLTSRHKIAEAKGMEDIRQLVHFFLCAILAAAALFLGTQAALRIVAAAFSAGIVLSHFVLSGAKIPIVSRILDYLEREQSSAGFGAMTLVAGCLAFLAIIPDASKAVSAIWILGAGDSASTWIGRRGRIPIFYNKKKTVEGTAAFFLACLPAALLAGWAAVIISAIAAISESLQKDADDNLIIALACLIGFELL
ncbi:MAG: phosphatase PAP2 family protein [Candidatus Micrarchaeota archaeon]|nr:phosphatase PAP2 family protein [Candidatus Micrarchaeota archaeon]